MPPCAAASSLPKRSVERADGPFSSAGAPVWAFPVRGFSRLTPGHDFFPDLFCRSRAGSKDASASGRAPYSGGTSVLYRSCGAQGVSGVFFRGYGLPQRFFPRVGTCCGAPGQRKSPPSDLFMALRLKDAPCAAASSLPKRSAERADGPFSLWGHLCGRFW